MEFRLLGPLEIIGDDGRPLEIPGRVHPRLLAVLLLDAGRVLSPSTLIEAVWDGDAPATAINQLRNSVPVLRKALGERVERSGQQYRIRADDSELDFRRFTRSVAKARTLRSSGDDRGALGELRTGLELWRGGVLSGMSGRHFHAAASALEEQRLTAVEDRIDLELALNEHSGVVADLRRLVVDHPHRQRIVGQLMLALYREGRAPEALEIYQAVNRTLADELGIDVGNALRDLHTAILRDDQSLMSYLPRDGAASSPSPTPASPSPRVPAQLPARPMGFVGRAAQLSALNDQLTDIEQPRFCLIAGPAGVGKTALAVHWGHHVRDRFPDGQLYVNLQGFDPHGPVDVTRALDGLVRALQPADMAVPTDIDALTGLYRSLVDDLRVLIVVDNARDAAQVRRLLPPGSTCFTIITSRNRLAGLTAIDSVRHMRLSPLPRSEAVNLLAESAAGPQVRVSSDEWHQLAELCGDLPLALRIASAHLDTHTGLSASDYISELGESDRLDALTIDGDPDASVSSALEQSFLALDIRSQTVLCLLGLVPGNDFPHALVGAVGGIPPAAAQGVLRQLETAHLVEHHSFGRSRFHDLTKEYARQRVAQTTSQAVQEAAIGRAIDWYHDRRFDRLTDNYDNLVSAVQSWNSHPHLWKLLDALCAMSSTGHDISVITPFLDAALQRALEQDDVPAVQAIYHCKGQVKANAGDHASDLAYSRKARDAGPDPTGYYAYCLAGALHNSADPVAAERFLTESMRHAQATGNTHVLMSSGRLLGHIHHNSGRYPQAEAVLTEALTYGPSTRLSSLTQAIEIILARIHIDTGHVDTARQVLQAVLNEPHILAPNSHRMALMARSEIHVFADDFELALDDLERALDLSQARAERFAEIEIRIALALCRKGDYGAALAKTASVAPPTPVTHTRGLYHHAVANIHNGLGNFHAAKTSALHAFNDFAEISRPLPQARSLVTLSEALYGLGDHDAATAARQRAITTFSRLGIPVTREVRIR
ncbi:MAG TPA: BTAD domain-containing putative transcriptional regulator [Stackebrandtia sp.]|uniref:AfsR/SARP family transcriptional regulator n=1 Tax=Stackebrandtia sp. TaxID=2023065 RepID=UPI002D294AB8|nr:BTAD domain-containing putative transcriptional regulator [Stackebrandtia sp.]HZE40675.1 BTAD domain-containing putative transcriptional regulator [Stackebrandtia sp.]